MTGGMLLARNSTMVGQPLAAALDYAARGWPVLPLCWPLDGACGCGRGHTERNVGKAPLTPHGKDDATTNPAQIRAWWQGWPAASVGIAVEPAGLLVVAPDSPGWVKEFMARGLPPGPTSLSGGGQGHQHYYFRRPAGCPIRAINRPGEYDVMTRGYAVAPPSMHRAGVRYRWDIPPGGELPEAPGWALDMLREAADRADVAAVAFGDDLGDERARELYARVRPRLEGRITRAIEQGPAAYVPLPDGDGSRSGADAAVCTALARAGLSDDDIRAIFVAFPIGRAGKFAERGDQYLAGTIAAARQWTAANVTAVHARPARTVAQWLTSTPAGEVASWLR